MVVVVVCGSCSQMVYDSMAYKALVVVVQRNNYYYSAGILFLILSADRRVEVWVVQARIPRKPSTLSIISECGVFCGEIVELVGACILTSRYTSTI